ncbi:hypothetical protein ACFE04_024026 [Oxalis oulophora]
MVRMNYLAMRSDSLSEELIEADINELRLAANRLINDASKLGGVLLGTSFLKWLASFSAIYLLILDRTNWRSNMLTALLVPYIFFSLPHSLFHTLRGDFGKWVSFVAVVLRLFFPRHFPDWLEIPGSLILLHVVAPNFFAVTLKDSWVGLVICLFIGFYLLQEHIRATGGFRNSFTQSHGISNTIGIMLLLVYPVWALCVGLGFYGQQQQQQFRAEARAATHQDANGNSGYENSESRLYVGNLDPRINEAALIKMFSPYGRVVSEDFLWHTCGQKRGEPRGYAFIQFSTREEAELAKEKMHGRLACKRPLVVRFSGEKCLKENTQNTSKAVKEPKKIGVSSSSSGQNSRNAKIAAIKNKLKDLGEEASCVVKKQKVKNCNCE